jgi:hypothetical protein
MLAISEVAVAFRGDGILYAAAASAEFRGGTDEDPVHNNFPICKIR